jgi:hypothetical protein
MTQTMTSSLETMVHRSQVLQNPKAIALLHNSKYRDLIRFFMQQPSTIQMAAIASGQTVQRTYNYVQRLHKAGFLEVSSSKARRGKPLKFYAATADDYFVPFTQSKAFSYGVMIDQELASLQRQMLVVFEEHLVSRDPLDWGMRLFKDPNGFTHLAFTPSHGWKNLDFLMDLLQPDAPALTNFWAKIKLPHHLAKALQLELLQVWRKYYFAAHTETDTEALENFGVGMMLVPLDNKSSY